MFRVVVAGLLFLLSSSVFAFKFPIEMIEGVDGAKVVVYVNKSDIDSEARWMPFDEAPPLSMTDALAAVKAYLKKSPDLPDSALEEIQLRRIPHHENDWHYMVVMRALSDGKPVLHYYAVLMSGKVIQAIREPESFK
ncbi:hypothetical protein MNBD_GAMMA15-1015 [hydrothermal vent metagenome]|uniref:PepSY domain-containing protein n=1 Tax=hydrothermal vent metagenome TaxID=652676 RepID=A0A3B0YRL4_9ZZZZ